MLGCDFPLQHVGVDYVDYAGTLYVRDNYSKSAELYKAYIRVFTCTTTQCTHPELITDFTTETLILAIIRFISRRDEPYFFISDNFKIFISKGLKRFLLKVDISWKYILEKSPWWGGFYERIIGIIKNCLKKVIWKPCLRYCEVETVLVEIEHTLNSRPLTYMSEENYAESITPHHLLYGWDINRKNSDINYFIELSEASDARKQLSNLQQIVSHINKRFYNEYILALRERHQYDRQSHHPHLQNVSIGDIVLVKDVNLPRLRWKKGRITKLIKGNDGLVRGVSLDTVVSTTNKTQCINRPLQHIIPLQLKDIQQSNKNIEFIDNDNSEAAIRSNEPRSRRVAAVNADILRRLRKW